MALHGVRILHPALPGLFSFPPPDPLRSLEFAVIQKIWSGAESALPSSTDSKIFGWAKSRLWQAGLSNLPI